MRGTNKFRRPLSLRRRLTTAAISTGDWNSLLNYWADTNPFPGYEPEPYPGLPMPTLALETMLAEAQKYLGYSYSWGGKTPPYFDCSGYVGWCYKFAGIMPTEVVAYTGTIWTWCQEVGTEHPLDTAPPGSIVVWGIGGTAYAPNAHVAIYIGNNTILDAASSGVDYRPITWHDTVAQRLGIWEVSF